jgi:hypothetical protein
MRFVGVANRDSTHDQVVLSNGQVPAQHRLPGFRELAAKYGITYGNPDWMDDIVSRYGLRSPTH